MKVCKIDNCLGKSYCRELCIKHYRRFMRHGDVTVSKNPNWNKYHVKTGVFVSWKGMMMRCYREKEIGFHNYGGRGIKVCDRWHIFENFKNDMGDRPEGKSIDRINVNGDYCPENCKWSTIKEQSRNKRVTKLTEQKVSEIRKLYNDGMQVNDIWKLFPNVCRYTISRAARYKTWS